MNRTAQRRQRLRQAGYSFSEIAALEGVSKQAVQQTLKGSDWGRARAARRRDKANPGRRRLRCHGCGELGHNNGSHRHGG